MSEFTKASIVFGVGVVFIAVLVFFAARGIHEQLIIEDMKKVAVGVLDNPMEVTIKENYVIDYGIAFDREYRWVKVSGPGIDKQWNTKDDLSVEERDYNKSKMVGEFLGKRLKEVGRGFVEGLKTDSDFSIDNGEN